MVRERQQEIINGGMLRMLKIKDLEIGKSYTIPLVVTSVTARETKTKKPYLALEFYDGTDKIAANYWDWSGKAKPEVNAILDVTAQVTEWQGAKQLNIKALNTNTEKHISEFSPASGVDVPKVYMDVYAMATDIKDDFIRELTVSVLETLQSRWLSAPAAISVHHAYAAGTLIHSLSVATIAKTIAEQVEGANVELCIVGGLLHDLGKLFSYKINGVVCEMTDEGKLLDHIFIGAEFLGNFAERLVMDDAAEAKLEMVRHIILSHHGSLEHGAVVVPASMEAHIVHHADAVDSVTEMIRDASKKVSKSKWTDKIYPLNNRPHLTPEYVQVVMDR